MFKNYLLIALRNLFKNKLYSAINILGLAIGLGTCLMLMLLIIDRSQYDQSWTDADDIYRIESIVQPPGQEKKSYGNISGKAKQTLLNYFPEEIKSVTRFNEQWPVIKVEGKLFEEKIHLTDAETADIFDMNILKGDFKKTLTDKRSIALSEELAVKYYGNINVIGKVLTIDNFYGKHDYKVGAVFQKISHNSVLSFNALIKFNEEDFAEHPWMSNYWLSATTFTYFKLKPGADIDNINRNLMSLVADNVAVPNYWAEQYSTATEFYSLATLPMQDIYLNYPKVKTSLIISGAIGLLILVLACFNFTNLSIARSTRRAREVAMRKVVGASRAQLMIQFLGETILIALIALLIGVALAELLMPAYNNYLKVDLQISYNDVYTLVTMFALVLFVGIVGGIYPAFILSGFRPAEILKANKTTNVSGSAFLSNVLVVFQFVVSIGLIICAVVIYTQRDHISNIELGYDKDHIVILHGVSRLTIKPKQQMIQQQIKTLPGIISASYIEMLPVTGAANTTELTIEEGNSLHKYNASFKEIDFDYQATFDMKLLAGRMFSQEFGHDIPLTRERFDKELGPFDMNILINEFTVKQFSLGDKPNDAIGKTFQVNWGKRINATVVGVIANSHYRSVREAIKPEVYMLDDDGAEYLAVHFTGSLIEAEKVLKKYWQENITDVPYLSTYVGNKVAWEFSQERRWSVMLTWAASLAVVIACMGLFGLASFTSERRTKEIGLRKVMGANVSNIVKLLVWQFSKPIIIASFLASIASFFGMRIWLEQFPYRIDTWLILPVCLAASLLAIAIAWLTVGGNAIKVARDKPIKALRYE